MAIHPLAERACGVPVYDGYVIGVASGEFVGLTPINQCSPLPPVDDPRYQIADVGVPVLRLMSQSDYLLGIDGWRPDGDTFPDLFRHYEIAGAGHATPFELEYSAAPEDIIAAGQEVPPSTCDGLPRSRFPFGVFFNAAFRNLDLWVRRGIAPPHGEPITVTAAGEPVLDEFGNVEGGRCRHNSL
jgi:hypothetical protein